MSSSMQASKLRRTDVRHIYKLLNQLQYTHVHLDWRDFDDWFKDPDLNAWVVRKDNITNAMIGATIQPVVAPEETYPIAWLRFMLPYAPFGNDPALHVLWHALKEDLANSGIREVATLIIEPWVEPYFKEWGFSPLNSVISLRRDHPSATAYPLADHYTLRIVKQDDIPAISRLDSRAFEGVWQYSQETLAFAWDETYLFTMIEAGEQVVAYQMSTLEDGNGHLARLAVDPSVQGQGLGKAIVGQALYQLEQVGLSSITVNTQGDNIRSQKLYERFGFKLSGSEIPIWTLSLLG